MESRLSRRYYHSLSHRFSCLLLCWLPYAREEPPDSARAHLEDLVLVVTPVQRVFRINREFCRHCLSTLCAVTLSLTQPDNRVRYQPAQRHKRNHWPYHEHP